MAAPNALPVAAPVAAAMAALTLVAVFVLIALNAGLYALFLRRGGPAFAVAAFGMHLGYFLFSVVTFVAVSACVVAKQLPSWLTQFLRIHFIRSSGTSSP